MSDASQAPQQPSPTQDLELIHDTRAQAFRALDRGQPVGEAHYTPRRIDGREQRVFDHTLTRPSHRGRGVAARLVERAIAETVAEGIEPQATCWYVQGWLREHPEALRV